jgi:hypothetical protein
MLLTAVGVNGSERDRLASLAKAAVEPNWVALGEPGASEALAALIEFERTAKHFTEWSPAVVPGILQTGDYARAIMVDAGVPPQEIDPRVTVRLGRRDVLTRRNAVSFLALVGQEALRQVIGGPEVMADQLRLLLQLSELPSVTLQVVPTGQGWHPGIAGPFELLEFESGRPIVHLEHLRSSLFLYENQEDLQAYVDAVTAIRKMAMSPKESGRLIAETVSALGKT